MTTELDPRAVSTLLVIASPKGDWVRVAEKYRRTRNVVVMFVSTRGLGVVREVRDRIGLLDASGVALAAMAFVGVVDTDAILELTHTLGVPLLG